MRVAVSSGRALFQMGVGSGEGVVQMVKWWWGVIQVCV